MISGSDKLVKILAIDHIVLRAHDMNLLVGFYCDVLGCELERQLPEELGMCQLRAGSALIDIVSVDGKIGRGGGRGPGKEGHNMDHFCLQIEACSEEELRSYLSNHKVVCGEFVERYGAEGMNRSLYIEDPEGNAVELKMKRIDR